MGMLTSVLVSGETPVVCSIVEVIRIAFSLFFSFPQELVCNEHFSRVDQFGERDL